MESKDFYSTLASLPTTYRFNLEEKSIVGTTVRGPAKGTVFNPITAVVHRQTGEVFGTTKRETQRAARLLGLTKQFAEDVYNATTSVSNRGNVQVVRGKIRSALGV